jgi:Ty3 transposon capsid-like protein
MSNPEFSGPVPEETSLPDWYQLFLKAKELLQTQDLTILELTQKFEEMEARMRQMQYEAFQNTINSANATPPLVVQINYKPAHPTPYKGMPSKLLPWIAQVETHMQLSRVTHPEHCLLVATQLLNPDVMSGINLPRTSWIGNSLSRPWRFITNRIMSRLFRDGLKKLRQKRSVSKYANDFNKLILKLPEMTEDEKMYCFITGLQTEVKLQVELQRPSDLQTAKEIADRADTIIFQAKPFSRGRGGPISDTASGNWPTQDETRRDQANWLWTGEVYEGREVLPLRKKGPSGQPAQRGWVTPKKLDCPGHSPQGYEESYQERKIIQQKNDKKKRTSTLHSRYDALKVQRMRVKQRDTKKFPVRRLGQKNIKT